MTVGVRTAGELLGLRLATARSARLAATALGALDRLDSFVQPATVEVEVVPDAPEVPVGARVLGHGGWEHGGMVLLHDMASSGYVASLQMAGGVAHVRASHRPSLPTRVLGVAAPGRDRLLRSAALFHYPVLWRAGQRGRAPLHASALRLDGTDVLLSGPSGIGKSTLVAAERLRGAQVASDNLLVSDGLEVFGLLEPSRLPAPSAGARRTTRGRWEMPPRPGPSALRPAVIVLLRRTAGPARLRARSRDYTAEALVAATYGAGELRRYWPLAATLAMGTGVGPAHPPVQDCAERLCLHAQCLELDLGDTPGPHLSSLLRAEGVIQCA